MKLSASMMGLGLFLALASCQSPELDNKDFADMNAVPLKPVCVGRLFVHLPQSGKRNWSASFDSAEVTRMTLPEYSSAEFWKAVEDRTQELKGLHHQSENSRLRWVERFSNNAAIVLFRDDEFQDEILEMERYVWLGDRGYFLDTGSHFNKVQKNLDRYKKALSQLRSLSPAGEPVAPGFCIDGATVIGDIGQIEAGLTVDLPQWKHTSLSIGTFELLPPAEEPTSAFQDLKDQQEGYSNAALRSPEVRQEPLYAKEFDILRKRERSVGGFAGQEAAWRKTLVNGAQVYQFIWQSQEPNGTPSQPGLVIQLSAGLERKPEDPPPPEEDLLALWDAVLESPKVR